MFVYVEFGKYLEYVTRWCLRNAIIKLRKINDITGRIIRKVTELIKIVVHIVRRQINVGRYRYILQALTIFGQLQQPAILYRFQLISMDLLANIQRQMTHWYGVLIRSTIEMWK